MAAPSRPNNPDETAWEPVVSKKQKREERKEKAERLSAALEQERRLVERQKRAREDPFQRDRNKQFSKKTLRICSKKTGYKIHERPVVIFSEESTDGESKDCKTKTNKYLSVCHVHVDEDEYKLQEFVVKNPTVDEFKFLEEWIVELNKGGIVMDSKCTDRVHSIIQYALWQWRCGYPCLIFW